VERKTESRRGLLIMQELFGIDGSVRELLSDDDLERVEQKNHPAIDYLNSEYSENLRSLKWKSYLKDIWPAWSTLTEHGAEEVRQVATPTLVVVGDRDVCQPVYQAFELYRHLPNAELAVIPGMDHFTIPGDRAGLLNTTVLDFLLRQTGKSASG
jgi:pimeloyl-ACP methyl ester carboxylesterase